MSDRPKHPGVIFDFDGTLADTLDDIADALNDVLGRVGRPRIPCARVRMLVGEGLANLLRKAAGLDDDDAIADLVHRYRTVYAQCMLRQTRLYPGIPAMLDAIAAHTVPMSVLSNKSHEFTAPMCDALLGTWPFVRFRGCLPDDARKPDPAAALELAAEMGRSPADVYFVGDSSTDVLTARNAGMISVAVTWGYRDCDDLDPARPAHYVHEPAQLVDLLR